MGLTRLRSGSINENKHSKQKFEKKLNFYSKVRDTVASLSAKKTIEKKKKLRSRQKKLKAYDLSALSEYLPDGNDFSTVSEYLPDVNAVQPYRESLKLNCKSRHKLLEKESAHLETVLQDSAFQADPLGAIHQYLKNTQPPASISQEKKLVKNQKRGKKKLSKVLAPIQAMETDDPRLFLL